ncbi:hypothetical protein GCM10009678_68540 [Actinomadura kijaniata]
MPREAVQQDHDGVRAGAGRQVQDAQQRRARALEGDGHRAGGGPSGVDGIGDKRVRHSVLLKIEPTGSM